MTWTTKLFSLLVTVFGDTDTFTLQDVYTTCVGPMSYLYPNNNHVEQKLCQTLQQLEELGVINFTNNGEVCERSQGQGVYKWVV